MSVTGDFGPAPDGVDLTENQDHSILSSVAVMMVLGVGSVVVRFYARSKSGIGYAIDDWFILLALVSQNT